MIFYKTMLPIAIGCHRPIAMNIFRVTDDLEKCIICPSIENYLSFPQSTLNLTYDLYLQSYGSPKRSHFFRDGPYLLFYLEVENKLMSQVLLGSRK